MDNVYHIYVMQMVRDAIKVRLSVQTRDGCVRACVRFHACVSVCVCVLCQRMFGETSSRVNVYNMWPCSMCVCVCVCVRLSVCLSVSVRVCVCVMGEDWLIIADQYRILPNGLQHVKATIFDSSIRLTANWTQDSRCPTPNCLRHDDALLIYRPSQNRRYITA